MLFAKQAWDKTTSFVLMNDILLTKLLYLTEKYPKLLMQPEAHGILAQIESTYHGNLELLEFVTGKLQEKDYSASSSLTEEKEHANKIRDVINQIYSEIDIQD